MSVSSAAQESTKLIAEKYERKDDSQRNGTSVVTNSEPEGKQGSPRKSPTRLCQSCNPGFPLSVYSIIGTEFCERFCYYGMRTVLIIYLTDALLYDASSATAIYHGFVMLCYFTPLFGGILADSLLGRFKTILILSLVYAVGSCALAATSFASMSVHFKAVGAFCGLLLIAIGTGGIKPCVSSFGADQIPPDLPDIISRFFSAFYFSVNAGSMISTIVSPILYSEVECGGGDCYPLAFGVPAALMLVAVLLFVSAFRHYKKFPPRGNVLFDIFGCFASATRGYFRHRKSSKSKADAESDGNEQMYQSNANLATQDENQNQSDQLKAPLTPEDTESTSSLEKHFLDYASDDYSVAFIEEVRGVLRVLLMLTPVPVFWALFDQQGSTWTLQAAAMNGNLFGWFYIQPNQIQVINPVLILLLIPIFETIVYPLFSRCNLLTSKRPLQRMVVGGLFASLAFVMAAFVQTAVDATLPAYPASGNFFLSVFNVAPYPACTLSVTSGFNASAAATSSCQLSVSNVSYLQQSAAFQFSAQCVTPTTTYIPFSVRLQCPDRSMYDAVVNAPISSEFVQAGGSYVLYIGSPASGRWVGNLLRNLVDKSEVGRSSVRFVNALGAFSAGSALHIVGHASGDSSSTVWPFTSDALLAATKYVAVDRATYSFSLFSHGTLWASLNGTLDTLNGASWTVLLYDVTGAQSTSALVSTTLSTVSSNQQTSVAAVTTVRRTILQYVVTDMPANSLSVFWQTPQYVLISISEILFAITGLNFAYSQAPPATRSVMTACWLLTVAVGNLLVVIVAELRLLGAVLQLYFFALLMLVDVALFALLAYSYVYVDYTEQALALAEKYDPLITTGPLDNEQPEINVEATTTLNNS